MKRLFWAAVTALLACLLMPVTAIAAPVGGRIHDTGTTLSAQEISDLNVTAQHIYEEYGFDVLLDIDETDPGSAQEYAERRYAELNAATNGVLLAITEDDWYIYLSGAANDLISEEDKDALWQAYNDAAWPFGGANLYLHEVDRLLRLGYGPPAIPAERLMPRLVDENDLLTATQEEALLAKLDEISQRQGFDVVIVTSYSLGGKTSTEYADDFFDYNGYGAGKGRDGILLLVSMEERDWAISTHGFGIPAFTDAGQQYMVEQFRPQLSDGDFAGAFTTFAELSDDFITQARNREPYDVGNMPDDFKPTLGSYLKLLLFSLPGGFLIAMLVTAVAKKKLYTVRLQPTARNYVRRGSVQYTDRRDQFLYSQVSRTARPSESSSSGSGGGSSSHTSSSGSSHGGSSGKF